ncbi:MAG: hypothetical protein BWK80_28080 [Desulfobacteraceae bacterium IS3]|nr:MAG: hypothetical protein BWK80_28080 [Desulfobacteraceae bacterium IS3]
MIRLIILIHLIKSEKSQFRQRWQKKEKNMRNFSMQSVGNQVVITVDLSFMNIESLNRLFERLRIEELIQKADFSDEITEIGTEIKQSWWQRNREQYLKGIINENRD